MRWSGVGRKLMTLAEAEAMQRGCHAAVLDTLRFQARLLSTAWLFGVRNS
jgi:hypothetical protein